MYAFIYDLRVLQVPRESQALHWRLLLLQLQLHQVRPVSLFWKK